jgi:hypothetical protein
VKRVAITIDAAAPRVRVNPSLYRIFYEAIRARYPHLVILCNVRAADGPVEVVDEHLYAGVDDMVARARQYDAVPRGGPAVYVGEYGCRSSTSPTARRP